MIIIIYFRQKVKIVLNNNKSNKKYSFIIIFDFFFLNFEFLFKTVNSLGSNNAKEHKVYPKSGKGAYMWFSYVSQILYEISADTT